MQSGHIHEIGPGQRVLTQPHSAHTRSLMASMLSIAVPEPLALSCRE